MTTIALDLEGTIADIHTPFVEVYNKKYKTNHTISDITHWGFTDGPIKATTDEFFDIVCELWMKTPNKIPPTESYVGEIIAKLQECSAVDILTQAVVLDRFGNYGRASVKGWLRKRWVHSIAINNSKERQNKLEFGRDIYVDDSPMLAKEAQKKKVGLILLYDRPWNQNIRDDKYVKRIFSLSEVLKYAKKF
jgi:5'(3')-deoxyribonucleotidase